MYIIDILKDLVTSYIERSDVINEFNKFSKQAFLSRQSTRFIVAKTTRGDSNFKHSMSHTFFSGFRLTIKNDEGLTNSEVENISKVILTNKTLLRQLMALGFDTLEIYGTNCGIYKQWDISKYSDLKGYFID